MTEETLTVASLATTNCAIGSMDDLMGHLNQAMLERAPVCEKQRKTRRRMAGMRAASERNIAKPKGFVTPDSFDNDGKIDNLYKKTVVINVAAMVSPNGKQHPDVGSAEVLIKEEVSADSALTGIAHDVGVDVAVLLAECSDLLDERDAARADNVKALRVIDAKNAVIATLEDQISRLKRPRVTVDSSLNDVSIDARKAAVLAFKLLALRQDNKIDAYVADSQGRYSKHPDFWISKQLSPLVDKGEITRDDLLLALQDPAVWYKTDKKLYRAKAKRNSRDSESRPLELLLDEMSHRKRTKSPRIKAGTTHNIGENSDQVVSV
jgi:hypothetical protein